MRFYHLVYSFAIIALLSGCSEEKKQNSPQADPQVPLIPVEYITIVNDNVPIWVEFTGKTEASKRVEITARVSGTLEEVLFNEGDYIEKGTKLFTIESDTYKAALQKAEAALDGHKASLALATADVKRFEPLVADGLAPRINLEQSLAKAAELKAAIKADKAQIDDAKLNLSYTTVIAPISGKISRIHVDAGNLVGPGGQVVLTTMVSDDPMYAYFQPPEKSFQMMRKYKIQEKMDARVRVPGDENALFQHPLYKGAVGFSDNRVDQATSTITMRAEVQNGEHTLLEGTFVYVDVFITDKAPLLMVIPAAVLEDQRGSFVYVVDTDNKVKRKDIIRGYETRNYMIVPEGLEAGDKVIISGIAKIREGLSVAPTDVTETRGILATLKAQNMIPEKE